jgi:hypothetical protein
MITPQNQIQLLELAAELLILSQLQTLPDWQQEAIKNYYILLARLQHKT